jgi:hypothetical protein
MAMRFGTRGAFAALKGNFRLHSTKASARAAQRNHLFSQTQSSLILGEARAGVFSEGMCSYRQVARRQLLNRGRTALCVGLGSMQDLMLASLQDDEDGT